NSSSLTLLPVTIFMYRAQQGADDPTLVFLPILLATTVSSLVGLLVVALVQRLGGHARQRGQQQAQTGSPGQQVGQHHRIMQPQALAATSSLIGNLTLFGIVILFLGVAALRRVQVYDTFIAGAREGFSFTISLLPYLIAMLVAIGVLRASGVLDA